MKSTGSGLRRVSWAVWVAMALGGCPPPVPGTPCTYNSQCPTPQLCLAGYCRNQCLTNRDCTGGQVCLDGMCTTLGDERTPADSAPADSPPPDSAPADSAASDSAAETSPDAPVLPDAPATDSALDAPPPMDAATDSAPDAPAIDVPVSDSPRADASAAEVLAVDVARADGAADAGVCAADGSACVPTVPATEVCDGIDNDCNGVVDERDPGGGGACTLPESNPCIVGPGTLHCVGGSLRCTATFVPAGSGCTGGQTCDASGRCGAAACVNGAPCRTNAMALTWDCNYGFRDCSRPPASDCVYLPRSPGSYCNMFTTSPNSCDDSGNCVQCSSLDTPCVPDRSQPCMAGVNGDCTIGQHGCVNVRPRPRGTECGSGMTCDSCGACTVHCSIMSLCTPANPCETGVWRRCDTIPPVCGATGWQPANTPCPGGLCDGRGVCR